MDAQKELLTEAPLPEPPSPPDEVQRKPGTPASRPNMQTIEPKYNSPGRVLAITISGIFLSEIIAMGIIYLLKPEPYWLETLLDGLIMVLIAFPVIYYFTIRTLLAHIAERKRVETQLSRYREHLEDLVDERTHEIEAVFTALQDGVLVYDQNMTVVQVNPSFFTNYGFNPIGLNIQEIIETVSCRFLDGRPYRLEDQPTAKALEGAPVTGAQYRITRPDGVEMMVETSSAPLWVHDQVNGSVTVWHNITALKQAESSLAYLASFPEQNPNPVTELDSEGSIRYTNPAALRIFPDLREQGLAHPWLANWEVITRPFRDDQTSPITRDIPVGDRIYHQSLNYLAPEGLVRVYGVDITQRKRAEEALRASEARLQVTLTSIGDGVIATDADGRITFLNPVAAALTGWNPERALGQPISRVFLVINEKTRWPTRNIVGHVLNERRVIMLSNDTVLIAQDGREVPIEDSAAPILDAAGEVTGVVLVFHDVTDKRRAQTALLESSKRLSQAQEIAHLGSWELDLVKDQLTWSDEVYRIFGLQPQEFGATYEAFIEAVHPDDRAAVGATYSSSVLEGRDGYEIEHRVVKRSTGEVRIVHEKCEHFRDEDDQIIRSVGMVHDITERKLADEALRAARDELELRVQERTQELAVTNRELSNEIAERKRAEVKLERQNEELRSLSQAEHRQRQLAEGLVDASIALNTSLDLEIVLDRIFESIQQTIPFKTAGVLLMEGENLATVRHWGQTEFQPADVKFKEKIRLESLPLLQDMARSRQPALVREVALNPEWIGIPGMEWVRSYLGAPLIAGNQVIGFINLNSDQPGIFDQEMADRLIAFAAPAALAIQNARLFSSEMHARQLAETLSAASLALNQTLDLESVMNTIFEYVQRLVPYDQASILLSEDNHRLTLRAADSIDPDDGQTQALYTSFDIWDTPYFKVVMSSLESLLIGDTRNSLDWTKRLDRGTIRNWLGVPLIVGGKAIGMLTLTKNRPDFFQRGHVQVAEALMAQVSAAIQNAWLFEQVRAGNERHQSLSRRLVEVQESERRYIARELHDETGQALTSLIFGLRRLEQEVDHPENIPPQIVELKQVIDGVLENLHRLAMDLRPISLDHLGLLPALEGLVKDTTKRTGLNIRFKISGYTEEDRLPPDQETAIYRIVQEALTNVTRHAHASSVDVILEVREGRMIVIVEDDGTGFNTDEIPKSGHLGLLGMQERAEMMNGSLLIESRPEGGTTIVVEVPIAH